MNKIAVNLPKALTEFLELQVEAGLYHTVQDAIEDAVRRMSETDDAKLEALRAALAPGLADIEAGRFFEGTIEDILAEARARAASK